MGGWRDFDSLSQNFVYGELISWFNVYFSDTPGAELS